jgi:hypothetical protein
MRFEKINFHQYKSIILTTKSKTLTIRADMYFGSKQKIDFKNVFLKDGELDWSFSNHPSYNEYLRTVQAERIRESWLWEIKTREPISKQLLILRTVGI